MGNLLSKVVTPRSTLSNSTSIRSPNSSADAGAMPDQGTGDEESSPEQPPEGGNQSDNNISEGADKTDDQGHRDRIAVQTAALAALAFSTQLLGSLPKVVEAELQIVYEANVTFLCIIFFYASYTFLHAFFKEEPAARRREKKLIVPIYVSMAITFALRVSLDVLFTVSWIRILLVTAVASLLGWLYLRRTEGDRVWFPLIGYV